MCPDSRDLNDERSLRLALEERLAKEVDRTRVWRDRAEERMARIRELETRLERRRRLPRPLAWAKDVFSRRPVETTGQGSPSVSATRPGPRPRLASVTIAAVSSHPAVRTVLEEATVLDPAKDRAAVARSDLIVIDTPGWQRLRGDARRTLLDEMALPEAPPLVVWTDGTDDDLPRSATTVSLVAGGEVPFLAGSYPRRPPAPDPDPAGAHPADLTTPGPDLIAAAAAGQPLLDDDAMSEGPPGAAGHRSLRWAYRHHRPELRLSQLLTLAGVAHPDPTPTVAAVLVSNRPGLAADAVAALGRQTWRPLEVVVGLHGFDDPGLVPPAQDVGLTVLSFDESTTLGECLNRAISATTADVIAKIDDDDHYGPAYLEDALRDLDSSPASMVGKASVYAYLADRDLTILRRPGTEHRMIDGTVGGNTLVMARAVWEEVAFPHRPRFVDTIFITAARGLGFQLYSGARFEFCAVRHGSGHTYAGSDTLLAAGSEEAWPGLDPARSFVADLEVSLP